MTTNGFVIKTITTNKINNENHGFAIKIITNKNNNEHPWFYNQNPYK